MSYLSQNQPSMERRIKGIRASREKLEKSLTILHREIRDASLKLRTISNLELSADEDDRRLAAQYKQFLVESRKKAHAFADEIESLRDRELALHRSLTTDYQVDSDQLQNVPAKPAKKKIERIRLHADPIRSQPVHGNMTRKKNHLILVWVNPAL